MSILQSGQAIPNLPGLYINVVPPQTNFLSPAQTDLLGIVGTAPWGPVNAPTNVGSLADYVTKFGLPQNRKYDLGTPVWTAGLQYAQSMRCVRVTDGTDVAGFAYLGMNTTPTKVTGGSGFVANDTVTFSNGAVLTVLTVTAGAIITWSVLTQPTAETSGTLTQTATSGIGTGAQFSFTYLVGLTLASKWTGSGANGDTATLAVGSQTGTWKLTLFHNGNPTEVFDNIGFGLTANALWIAIAAAVNSGNAIRAPSALMVATAGASTAAPSAQAVALAGGTDGVSAVTATTLVGTDTSPRTGMYALRTQGCSVGMLSDCDTSTTWPSQVAFGLGEGVYMIGVTPQGDTITNAVTTKATAGIDSYAFKLMFGDWCYFLDTINGLTRLVSPQGFAAGRIAAWGPQFSSLNQPLYGIVGTQKTATNTVYMQDDLVTLNQAGFEVITNPVPGGSYFGCRTGHNSASNGAVRGDNYVRMTNFIAATLNQGLGMFIGQLQSVTEQAQAKATLDAFFNDLWTQGAIGSSVPQQIPWQTTITNNQSQVTTGQQIANVSVIYLSVIEQFIVNVQGGQTVTIPSGTPQRVGLTA